MNNEIKGYQKEIKYLQKENKILKENAEHNDKVVDKAKWNEMIYKSRIDKAIEYVNHAQNYGTMAQVMPHLKPYVNGDDLLNILKGEDE